MNGRNTGNQKTGSIRRQTNTFNRIGPARAQAQREKWMVVGGGSVILALLILSTLLLTNRSDVDARTDIQVEPQLTEEVAFGTVTLIAPKAEVAKGTKLARVELSKVYWPRDQVPEGAVREVENVRNMFAFRNLAANQPIVRSDLADKLPTDGISGMLAEGFRAISLQVDAEEGVEGWATPGAHVDVLLTYHDRKLGHPKTLLIVEGAVVLSFDGSTRTRNKDLAVVGRQVSDQSTVTLMVSLEDSLELQTAKAMGTISLVLRNVIESQAPSTRSFTPDKWEKTQKSDKRKQDDAIKGFIRVPGKDGGEKTLYLQENSWFESGDSEGSFGE